MMIIITLIPGNGGCSAFVVGGVVFVSVVVSSVAVFWVAAFIVCSLFVVFCSCRVVVVLDDRVIGLGCLRLDIVGEVKVTYEKIFNNKKNSLNHANERFGTLFPTQRLPLVGAFRILKLGLTILFLFWEESLMFTKV